MKSACLSYVKQQQPLHVAPRIWQISTTHCGHSATRQWFEAELSFEPLKRSCWMVTQTLCKRVRKHNILHKIWRGRRFVVKVNKFQRSRLLHQTYLINHPPTRDPPYIAFYSLRHEAHIQKKNCKEQTNNTSLTKNMKRQTERQWGSRHLPCFCVPLLSPAWMVYAATPSNDIATEFWRRMLAETTDFTIISWWCCVTSCAIGQRNNDVNHVSARLNERCFYGRGGVQQAN